MSIPPPPFPEATGKIGIYFLKSIWAAYQPGNQSTQQNGLDSSYVSAVFNTLGLGLEPTIKYLYSESPSFEQFEDWIIQQGKVSLSMVNHFNSLIDQKKNNNDEEELEIEQVLTAEELAQWKQDGYYIIKNAISKEDCTLTRQLIFENLDADHNDPESWYRPHSKKQGIMVQLFHHPQLDKNRLTKKIKKVYEQLWGRKDLMVSMDRVSFNPPESEQYHFPGPNLHWDVSLKRPIPFGLQGLLYLSDTSAEQGAFTLVPGFHHQIDDWLESLPKGANPREQDLISLGAKAIAGEAGDFIIWRQSLPHGSSPNRAAFPRIVQYINYQPIHLKQQEEWI